MNNNFLTTDIILFFIFIKTLIIYLVLKLVITDGYNLYMNFIGTDCGTGRQANCNLNLISQTSTPNRMSDMESLFITDLLNFAFVGISVVFWTFYERFNYRKFVVANSLIQTEDDFSIFGWEKIPVVQSTNNGVINYKHVLKEYFNSIVVEWLENPVKDELYHSYVAAAAKHNHSPNSPPKIVSKINLCWNLYELSAIHDLKDNVQGKF